MPSYRRKTRRVNLNRGNLSGSRATRFQAYERKKRFRTGIRGGWRSNGYTHRGVGKVFRRKGGASRQSRLGTGGTAGGSTYVRLSALGKRRIFLGKIQRALASKASYLVLGSHRHTGAVNNQGLSFISHLDNADVKAAYEQCTGVTPNEGGKVYIQDCKTKIQIVNQANVPNTVWFYDIMLRRDSNDPLTPTDDFKEGVDQAGGSATDYLLPYITPFRSHRFCTKWVIKKVHKKLLAPGEEHIHNVNISVYRSVAQERLYTAGASIATGLVGLGGLTHFTMIVSLGGLINDNVTLTNVGYSRQAVDVAYTKSYRVCALYDDKYKFQRLTTLPAITTEQTMEEATADPATYQAA